MPAYTNTDLFNYLKDLNTVDSQVLQQEFDYANQNNLVLGESLIQRAVLTDDDIGVAVSDMLSLPYIDVSIEFIPENVLNLIPEEVARAQRMYWLPQI